MVINKFAPAERDPASRRPVRLRGGKKPARVRRMRPLPGLAGGEALLAGEHRDGRPVGGLRPARVLGAGWRRARRAVPRAQLPELAVAGRRGNNALAGSAKPGRMSEQSMGSSPARTVTSAGER